jgi:GNAT superfamily N-acetyltransferase
MWSEMGFLRDNAAMGTVSEDGAVVVRRMKRGDAESVAALVDQLGYSRTVAEVAAWIKALPEDASQAAFVACVGNEIAGWIEVSTERHLQAAPCALIGGLVVRDGVRGQRIGQRLCEEAERWAQENGLAVVKVTSRSTRAEAHRFYLRDGYEVVKTSLVFEKKLTP